MNTEVAYDLVRSIEAERERSRKMPAAALFVRDIVPSLPGHSIAEIRAALNELVKSQRLAFGRTINDVWFKSKA